VANSSSIGAAALPIAAKANTSARLTTCNRIAQV
jgi:hypothetical protein